MQWCSLAAGRRTARAETSPCVTWWKLGWDAHSHWWHHSTVCWTEHEIKEITHQNEAHGKMGDNATDKTNILWLMTFYLKNKSTITNNKSLFTVHPTHLSSTQNVVSYFSTSNIICVSDMSSIYMRNILSSQAERCGRRKMTHANSNRLAYETRTWRGWQEDKKIKWKHTVWCCWREKFQLYHKYFMSGTSWSYGQEVQLLSTGLLTKRLNRPCLLDLSACLPVFLTVCLWTE